MPTIEFKGKANVRSHHLAIPHHGLVPDLKHSILKEAEKPNLNGNLIVHGDNLLALKALLPTHAGKVDVVYIDPPYNTGNEKWAYNDNVDSPMIQEWLGKAVDKEDMTRHDKWLCMMWPRLKILRDLMSSKGVIFISIDDHEQHRLRLLMDEIFGAHNFITNIIWEKKYSPANDAKYFSDTHDFVVCYAKEKSDAGWQRNLLPRTESADSHYKYDDNDGRGPWRPDNLSAKAQSPAMNYPIVHPDTGEEHLPPKGRGWSYSKAGMDKLIEENRIYWPKKVRGKPSLKRYFADVQQGIVPGTVWLSNRETVGHSDAARRDLKKLFPDVSDPFENPKPVPLIERILQIAANKNSTVLDSFAGSGTTAEAVLSLNDKDGGNRKFILIECEDYAGTTTAERVRRVINAQDNSLLGTTRFTYYTLSQDALIPRNLLSGKLPSWLELARYLFFTATGENLNDAETNEEQFFCGHSKHYDIYLRYKPDIDFLKNNSFKLEDAQSLPEATEGRKRLVYASNKYADSDTLGGMGIEFCRLPFEVILPTPADKQGKKNPT